MGLARAANTMALGVAIARTDKVPAGRMLHQEPRGLGKAAPLPSPLPAYTYVAYACAHPLTERPLVPARESLIPGTLNVLILKTLSLGPRHGYGISKWIGRTTEDVFQVEEGVLYPALHRLERDGLIASEWLRAPTGRRAKFYSLTEAGEKALQAEMGRWERSSGAVRKVLRAES